MIFSDKQINVLLIEDEEFDVRRVINTIAPFSNQIKICQIVSNGKSALEYLEENKGKIHVVIMDYQIAGGLMAKHLFKKSKK